MNFLRKTKKLIFGDQASIARAKKIQPSTIADWLAYYEERDEIHTHFTDVSFPKISILVLTYNNLDYTRICLKSIFCNTTYPNYEVVVVDNASTDGSQGWLSGFAETHTNVKLILNEKNLGFSAGNNLAANAAIGEYLVFLNNDTVVTHGWLERMLSYIQNDPTVGLIGPVTNSTGNEARISTDYNSPADMETFAKNLAHQMNGRSFDIRMLAFFCVMARKEEYLNIGGLDERFLVGMFEDDDLAVRYHNAGKRVVCAEDVFVHHFQSMSFNKFDDEKYRKIFEENRKKYEKKWGRAWEPYQARQTTLVQPLGILRYRCNICGRFCETNMEDIGREKPSCQCGSTVRSRTIIHLLSMELFGRSLALPDFPSRKDIHGWGMSDAGYTELLSEKIGYINTYYDREPRFDITETLSPEKQGSLDFLISTEVFEHVASPISYAFENARRLLKPNGILILTVPFSLEEETQEHFPELHKYEIIPNDKGGARLKNITVDGREQWFDNLVFHGGVGTTLEMRVFSRNGLLNELKNAGFEDVEFYSAPYWGFGIYWHQPWSLPLIARVKSKL